MSLQLDELTLFIVNSSINPMCLVKDNAIVFANTVMLNLLSITSLDEIDDETSEFKDVFGHRINHLFKQDNHNWFDKALQQSEFKIFTSNNNKKHTHCVKIDYLQQHDIYLVQLHDITKEIEHELEIKNILYTDNLTKMENRSKLIHDLRYGKDPTCAIAIVDINSFKEINDFYGNKIGDLILINVANIIQDTIKPHQTMKLYKFPADIYAITHTSDNKEAFMNAIIEIIDKIEQNVYTFDQYEIDTRATAGISFSHKNNKLITADLALQAAKKDHKDYLVFYDELDNLKEYQNNMVWTKKLKTALAKDNIVVYYQPLINNKTLKVDKYECLVRMIDNESIISPFFFLDISKKSNQYHKITRSVIQKSFKEFENLPFEFSINISYEDIEHPNFLDFIKEMFKLYNVKNKVVFEILEDQGIKNYSVLAHFITQVKALGCKVAIDDFGSGYSNFEHLLKMNVDYLKIDASLVKNIVQDENSYKVTQTIIEFAKNLNLKTIAEYVENPDIFKIVKDLGADYSQGYYFSAPLKVPNLYCCKDKDIYD
jgi:diguanylate cyclase (GGDEF)-like protein